MGHGYGHAKMAVYVTKWHEMKARYQRDMGVMMIYGVGGLSFSIHRGCLV